MKVDMAAFAIALLIMTSSSTSAPTVPGGGALIWWWICASRKKNSIGGWLLFYFWQIYSGAVMSWIFFAINYRSYIPENFDTSAEYGLFLLSTAGPVILISCQAIIAIFLQITRAWDVLLLQRW